MPSKGVALVHGTLSCLHVVDITRITPREAAETKGECVGERYVHGATHAIPDLVSVVDFVEVRLQSTAECRGGRVHCHKFEEAAQTVGTIKCALRTAQDFY